MARSLAFSTLINLFPIANSALGDVHLLPSLSLSSILIAPAMTDLTLALDYAKTKWLKDFLQEHLPLVANLTHDTPDWQAIASAWKERLDALFIERGLPQPYQQKNRRSDVVNSLRQFNLNHPAIPYSLLPTETYTQLNLQQAADTQNRETKFLTGGQAIELVDRATTLLDSNNPYCIAAGLAVLLGRRISEILLSGFAPCTDYSLTFSEPAKRRGETGLSFEIPTLAPAAGVLAAIARVRGQLEIDELLALDLAPNQLKQRINKKYEAVPDACRLHFADLVPGRASDNDSGERLYTHLFRAIYAEIATYFYKPRYITDHNFKAEIQGHFKLTGDGKIRNYTARPHYDDYLISDRRAGDEGIKLGQPGVEVLSCFQKNALVAQVSDDSQPPSQNQESVEAPGGLTNELEPHLQVAEVDKNSSLETNKDDNDEDKDEKKLEAKDEEGLLLALLNNERTRKLLDTLYPEQSLGFQLNALLDWAEARLSHKEDVNWFSKINQHDTAIAQLQRRIEALETAPSTKGVSIDPDRLAALQAENERLIAENQTLREERDRNAAKLDALSQTFQQLMTNGTDEKEKGVANPMPETGGNSERIAQKPSVSPSPPKLPSEPKTENVTPTRSRPTNEEALGIIDKAIDALIAYNNADDRPLRDKWYVSRPALYALLRGHGYSVSQKNANTVLERRKAELDAHHSSHLLSARHNVRHGEANTICGVIAL